MTNHSEHLYLISDGVEIYGLGEINWNMQKSALAIRVDFKGISKYSLVYICTEEEELNAGKVFIEEEKNFFTPSFVYWNLSSSRFLLKIQGWEKKAIHTRSSTNF